MMLLLGMGWIVAEVIGHTLGALDVIEGQTLLEHDSKALEIVLWIMEYPERMKRSIPTFACPNQVCKSATVCCR